MFIIFTFLFSKFTVTKLVYLKNDLQSLFQLLRGIPFL